MERVTHSTGELHARRNEIPSPWGSPTGLGVFPEKKKQVNWTFGNKSWVLTVDSLALPGRMQRWWEEFLPPNAKGRSISSPFTFSAPILFTTQPNAESSSMWSSDEENAAIIGLQSLLEELRMKGKHRTSLRKRLRTRRDWCHRSILFQSHPIISIFASILKCEPSHDLTLLLVVCVVYRQSAVRKPSSCNWPNWLVLAVAQGEESSWDTSHFPCDPSTFSEPTIPSTGLKA